MVSVWAGTLKVYFNWKKSSSTGKSLSGLEVKSSYVRSSHLSSSSEVYKQANH